MKYFLCSVAFLNFLSCISLSIGNSELNPQAGSIVYRYNYEERIRLFELPYAEAIQAREYQDRLERPGPCMAFVQWQPGPRQVFKRFDVCNQSMRGGPWPEFSGVELRNPEVGDLRWEFQRHFKQIDGQPVALFRTKKYYRQNGFDFKLEPEPRCHVGSRDSKEVYPPESVDLKRCKQTTLMREWRVEMDRFFQRHNLYYGRGPWWPSKDFDAAVADWEGPLFASPVDYPY